MPELIEQLLQEIGPGKMSNVAYDTAWVARLGDIDWELSSQALDWLVEHQLQDGSWGAQEPFYYHDRVISTLAAMIALTHRGRRAHDKEQIERGLLALERITSGATQGLRSDPNGATIGFEMIAPTLVAEAEKLGIIKQQGESILKRLSKERSQKLSRIQGKLITRDTTMAFSTEMAGVDEQHIIDVENLQESNGSSGNSPSATAYIALYIKPHDPSALDYLHKTMGKDGGFPNLSPFDAFEISWTLWNLHFTSNLTIGPRIKSLLNLLANSWQPGRGIGFATNYSVKDSDMTSVVFDTLLQYGYKKDIESIFAYEEQEYFQCFPLEMNPSISANIHVLGALRQAGIGREHPSIQKLIRFLKQNKGSNHYWLDKWHSSPYYTTGHAIIAAAGYDDDLVRDSVEWIISSQQSNGSWGTYISTAEETAYALQALSVWSQKSGKIEPEVIRKGIRWLQEHSEGPYQPLWIGKCLYAPNLVIRSAVLSAIQLANEIL